MLRFPEIKAKQARKNAEEHIKLHNNQMVDVMYKDYKESMKLIFDNITLSSYKGFFETTVAFDYIFIPDYFIDDLIYYLERLGYKAKVLLDEYDYKKKYLKISW